MSRLPFPTIIVWLSLGMISGWWLHVFYQSPTFPSIGSKFTDNTSFNTEARVEENIVAAGKTEIEMLIEAGDYDLAFSRFGETRARNEKATEINQKAIISSLSKLGEKSPDETQTLLRRFLEEDAYNPQGLFLLAKSYFESGRHMRALETLFNLKSFNQTAVGEEDINTLLEQIETQYAAKLEQSEALDELLQLYLFLTAHDPANTARFYKLAQIQYRLHHYYDAMDSLNYVLYEPEWSKLAQNIADDIQQSINLEDDTQVPLKRVGEHFIVNASINGIEGARLMIDTGASLCVLRPQIAQQFGLPTDSDNYISLNLVAGVFNAPLIEIDTMNIGDASVSNVKTSVIEMPPDINSDGLLGMNFLSQFKFFIDQKREILYLGSK